MSINYLDIIRPGINSTFQDKGRDHLYHIGIPFSGAMDNRNYLIANKLVYNNLDSAIIEFAYQGPHIKYSGEKILENFLNKEYFCYMTGFIAGMPFLGDLDENMRAQRLETPRVKVPKGSVALTEQFANIYTFESPGGWNILGNTPLKVFDSSKEDKPNLINPGDTVIFKEITLDQYKNYNE